MTRKTWTLPPRRPIVEGNATGAQVLGILVVGCALGLLLAWFGSVVADSLRDPDTLNESGPWRALVPASGGQLEISDFAGDFGTLTTGCGEFRYSYRQSGTSLAFSALPPAPRDCVGQAAQSHVWFIGQLTQVATFTPAEFWRESDSPTITLLDASDRALLTLTTRPGG